MTPYAPSCPDPIIACGEGLVGVPALITTEKTLYDHSNIVSEWHHADLVTGLTLIVAQEPERCVREEPSTQASEAPFLLLMTFNVRTGLP